MGTDAFYRMFPAYLTSALPDSTKDMSSVVHPNIMGRCFLDITITTVFEQVSEEELQASVVFDLKDQPSWCAEHL